MREDDRLTVESPTWPQLEIGSTIRVHNSRSEVRVAGNHLWGLGNPPNVPSSRTVCHHRNEESVLSETFWKTSGLSQ